MKIGVWQGNRENLRVNGGNAVKKYEYKFVEVASRGSLKTKAGDSFEECKEIILAEAENGWRL